MHFGIIAAGQGSRLASEGFGHAKPLVRIDGVPLVERLSSLFYWCGAERIAVIINGYDAETVEFMNTLSRRLPIDLVIEPTESSMHSLHRIAPLLKGGRFCVTTVDTIFRPDILERYVNAFSQTTADCLMGVTPYIDDEKPLYVQTDAEMNITAFHDSLPKEGCLFISAGVYGLCDKALDTLSRCIGSGQSRMRSFQRALVADGLALKAFDMGKVIDIDHVSDIKKARKLLHDF